MLRADFEKTPTQTLQPRFQETRFDWLRCADDQERLIHIWDTQSDQAKGVLLAIHGGLAHAGDYCTVAAAFQPHGWTTVSFDMRGHNRQQRVAIDRFDDFIEDLELFIEWVEENFPSQPIYIVGHSMGALIAATYGLKNPKGSANRIRGYIFSSPYWANAVKLPVVLVLLAGVLSTLMPNAKAPLEDFTDELTHDETITARHRADEADHYRGSEATFRFAHELLKAQKFIQQNIHRWDHTTFAVIAGDDKLSDAPKLQQMFDQIQPSLLTRNFYVDNYHENFNELNREEIFSNLENWLASQPV